MTDRKEYQETLRLVRRRRNNAIMFCFAQLLILMFALVGRSAVATCFNLVLLSGLLTNLHEADKDLRAVIHVGEVNREKGRL